MKYFVRALVVISCILHKKVLVPLFNKVVGPGNKPKINKRSAYVYSGVQISLVSDHLKNGYEGLPKYTFFPVPLQPSIALGNKVGNGISHLEKKRRKRKMRLPFELRQVEESQSINRPGAQLAYFKVIETLLGLNIEQRYCKQTLRLCF